MRPGPSSSFCEARRTSDSCRKPPSAADDWKQESSGLEASSSLVRGGSRGWGLLELNDDRDGPFWACDCGAGGLSLFWLLMMTCALCHAAGSHDLQ